MCNNVPANRHLTSYTTSILVPGLDGKTHSSTVVFEELGTGDEDMGREEQVVGNDINDKDREGSVGVEFDDSSDTDDNVFVDSDYILDDVADDILFEKRIHPDIEEDKRGINANESNTRSSDRMGFPVENTIDSDLGDGDSRDEVNMSDDLYSLEGSDLEGVEKKEKKLPEFNVISDMDDPIFCISMLFAGKKELSQAIKQMVIKDKVNIIIKKMIS
ncbi:hypothetical protein PTKIN_Ptkin18bG0046700 [Pterospermum kingtungense]